MKVNIIIPKAKKGEFSQIQFGYEDLQGKTIQVVANIDFQNLFEFTNVKKGIGFDVFVLGCCVYCIDILLPRMVFSTNGWSREIEVEVPVESPEIFGMGKKDLEHLISFLTGDLWRISFVQRQHSTLYLKKPRSKVLSLAYRNSHKKVSLFSGGLDSLIGVIDQLSKSKNNKMVLVSHYDSIFKGPKSDQEKIHEVLSRKYLNYHLIQTRVDLSGHDIDDVPIQKETSLRSRSFLFLSLGVFVAHSISDGLEVLIPENGTISLNHPLTPSRRSSCSTRTAHPYYLSKVESFFIKLGLHHQIRNEYEMQTKGEMVEGCVDRKTLLATYQNSCSCAKRGTRKDIRDVSTGTNHCGICMPCIYRRVALNKIGMDTEIIGTDLFHPIKYSLERLPDIMAFLDYLKNPLKIEDIERNLLINGSLPLEKVREYAEVIKRTRDEITEWIRKKGSVELKRDLNIK
jgi:7-cyano-7-deazaguanine synthase in queuosine biosynthesis